MLLLHHRGSFQRCSVAPTKGLALIGGVVMVGRGSAPERARTQVLFHFTRTSTSEQRVLFF